MPSLLQTFTVCVIAISSCHPGKPTNRIIVKRPILAQGSPALAGSIINKGAVAWKGSSLNARMTTYNGYLFLAEYQNNKIAVFDIRTASTPVLINEFSCGAYPRDVEIFNGKLIVICFGSSVMQVYDITDPGSTFLVSATKTDSGPKMMVSDLKYGYIICGTAATLQKFDLSDLSAPVLVKTINTSNFPLGISYSNEMLAVVGWSQNLDLFNANTFSKQSINIGGSHKKATCVFFRDRLVIADRDSALLQVIDITSKPGVFIVNDFPTIQFPEQVLIYKNIAYVASLTDSPVPGSVDCFDLQDMSRITFIKNVGNLGSGTGFLAVASGHLYVSTHFSPNDLFVIKVP